VKRFFHAAVFLFILMCIAGCSGPSKDEARGIALSYFKGMYAWMEKEDIEILKTYSKDSNTIVVLQIGEAICDMTVVKGKDAWLGRQISCGGSITPPKGVNLEERYRAKKIASIKKDIEELNKKCPYFAEIEPNARYDKLEFDEKTNTVIFYKTYINYEHADAKSKNAIKTATNDNLAETCNSSGMPSLIYDGVSARFHMKAKDGSILHDFTVDKEFCDKLNQKRNINS